MIGKLIDWSLRNRIFVLFGGLLLLLWGAFEHSDAGRRVPEPHRALGHRGQRSARKAPERGRELLIYPLETALNGAPVCEVCVPQQRPRASACEVEFEGDRDSRKGRSWRSASHGCGANAPGPSPEPTLAR